MSALVQSVIFWLRRNLAWSNSRQSWQERLGVLVLLLGGGLILYYGGELALGQKLALWLAWLAALAVVLRRGWLKLFGPVLFYDMVRVGRRSRYILLRTIYVGFLFLVMSYVYSTWSYRHYYYAPSRAQELGAFAESFFYTFMGVQFLVLFVLTPAYVAGAIADEKNRKTLEFLLATDLRNREIVLGKLIARLANLILIVLAGLPVLAFTQFFGGVDPDLLLASFAAQAMTVFSMAGLSILFSVFSRRPRDAIVFTYLTMLAYPTLSLAFWGVATGYGWTMWGFTLPGFLGGSYVTLGDFFGALNAGNPIYALITFQMQTFGGGGGTAADVVAELNRNYMIFHGLVGLVCTAWAVARLRAVALRETYAKEHKLPLASRVLHRPAVGDDGMMWKEVFIENNWKMSWLGRGLLLLLVLASFVPAALILWEYLEGFGRGRRGSWQGLEEAMNVWVRSVGTIVACLTLLGVTVRGASSVGSERDRQTLDALLTTPLSTNRILWAKWVGSVLSMRWAAVWLGAIWLAGLITGGLNPLAAPLLVLSWLIYAGVFALVGIWYSVTCKTTGSATIWSLVTAVFIGGTHWCLWSMCLAPLGFLMRGGGPDMQYVAFFAAGQTPPAVLAIFAFHGEEFDRGRPYDDWSVLIGFCLFGLACWMVAAMFLADRTSARFKQLTGRDEQFRGRELTRRTLEGSPEWVIVDEDRITRLGDVDDRITRPDEGIKRRD